MWGTTFDRDAPFISEFHRRVPHVSLLWRRGRPERPLAQLFKEQALQQTSGAPCLPSLETWETRTTTCPALQKASYRLTLKTRAGTARSVAPGGRTAKVAASNRGVTKSISTHQSPGGHNLTLSLSRRSKKMRLKKVFPNANRRPVCTTNQSTCRVN
jgi:hypothetical protein